MSLSNPNRSPATLTKNRVKPAPGSGICVTCLDSCPGPCEIGRSAIRGREMLYPSPSAMSPPARIKTTRCDFSHFNVQGTCVGADGHQGRLRYSRLPGGECLHRNRRQRTSQTGLPGLYRGPGLHRDRPGPLGIHGHRRRHQRHHHRLRRKRLRHGPPRRHQEAAASSGLRKWSAASRPSGNGIRATVTSSFRPTSKTAAWASRSTSSRNWGVEFFELKWGQGAKNIGGEVKLPTLERAQLLKSRGYIVLPDPTDSP